MVMRMGRGNKNAIGGAIDRWEMMNLLFASSSMTRSWFNADVLVDIRYDRYLA